jgi:NADH-quinone oxidoreductase subunit H
MTLFEQTLPIVLWGSLAVSFAAVNALFLVWMERRVSARIQIRRGPIHVGPQGLLQTLADAVKLVSKELSSPKEADRWVYAMAPLIAFMPLATAFIILPLGPGMIVRDLNVGFLLIFSLTSVSFIGIFIAGWSSNSKYALLGSMRAVAQNISYEIPLFLSTMGVVMVTGSMRMSEIIAAQDTTWFVFTQPLAFIIFFCSALAEANRAPFDIPEAESELVAGFHTEYSGIRFALFMLGEYTSIFIASAVAVTLFLGGWQGPVLPGIFWFTFKVYGLIFVMMWVRWTFPRLRSDQLMAFAWKVLIPFGLLNILLTAGVLQIQRMLQ